MLETIREYARERLVASGEAAAVGRRHAGYVLAFAERDGGEVRGPDRRERRIRLEREFPNIRAALAWSIDAGEVELGLRLATAAEELWIAGGRWSEGRRWLEQLLTLPPTAPPPGEERRGVLVRARALTVVGDIAHWQYDRAEARRLLEEGLALARTWDDGEVAARALARLGLLTLRSGDGPGALALYEQALALRRALGDPAAVAQELEMVGYLALAAGDAGRARTLLQEALASWRALGDRGGAASALNRLAGEALRRGALTEARTLIDEALALAREVGQRQQIAWVLLNVGAVARAQGDAAAAGSCYHEALHRCWEFGSRVWTAMALAGAGGVAVERGRAGWAARLLGAARAAIDAAGAGPPIWDEDAYQRDLAHARARLGAEAAAAWEIGRAAPLAEMVRLALADETPTDRAPAGQVPTPNRRTSGPLTARERGVAALVARGLTNRQIAAELVIAERTVGNHLAHIMNRLGVHTRAQVAVWAATHDPVTTS